MIAVWLPLSKVYGGGGSDIGMPIEELKRRSKGDGSDIGMPIEEPKRWSTDY